MNKGRRNELRDLKWKRRLKNLGLKREGPRDFILLPGSGPTMQLLDVPETKIPTFKRGERMGARKNEHGKTLRLRKDPVKEVTFMQQRKELDKKLARKKYENLSSDDQTGTGDFT